ncbi:peroxiredoxin [Cuniculiplasma sp. SKW3]|uniref:peroxiredoxin n=1 Tax=Cuniculiplasma sp. SKW3 TaxID=3400170 RepID=UPI003FCF3E7A
MTLEVGREAPLFSAYIETGEKMEFKNLIGRDYIILYFYPKDDSFGCKREACEFRDEFDEFKLLDATVLGVSVDSVESHVEFRKKRNLPFHLISDPDEKIWKMYDVKARSLQYLNQRVTYVIDTQGIIRYVYSSQIHFRNHPAEARKALLKLKEVDARRNVLNIINRNYNF